MDPDPSRAFASWRQHINGRARDAGHVEKPGTSAMNRSRSASDALD